MAVLEPISLYFIFGPTVVVTNHHEYVICKFVTELEEVKLTEYVIKESYNESSINLTLQGQYEMLKLYVYWWNETVACLSKFEIISKHFQSSYVISCIGRKRQRTSHATVSKRIMPRWRSAIL